MPEVPSALEAAAQATLAELDGQGLLRSLRFLSPAQSVRAHLNGREMLNFSANDYLGLANSEALKAAFIEGIERYGAGSGASRLVCGGLEPHRQLELALADFKGTEAALAFSSGFAVPMGVIPAVVKPGDWLLLDKLCHASLVDAAKLSGAVIRVFPHNHLGKLERLLQAAAKEKARALVVAESIYSMDGDAAALAEIIELKDRYGAALLLDEAHAVGVIGPQGRGLAAALGLEQRVDLHMGTLSKALGLAGGYIAGSQTLMSLLVNRARSFIYSTAPPPALAHAACAALALVRGAEGEALRQRLETNRQTLVTSLPGTASPSAIFPIIVGDEARAMQLSAVLAERGYLIPAIRFPTVARGSARLRVTLSAAHSVEDVAALAGELISSCPDRCR